MRNSKQNRVPAIFNDVYTPLLAMKKLLQSNKVAFNDHENRIIVRGLMISHFFTFLVSLNLLNRKESNTKCLIIRATIEHILEPDLFDIPKEYISRLISFVDQVGKCLNLTKRSILDVEMYNAYLNYEIYYRLNVLLKLFEFKSLVSFIEETVRGMKFCHDSYSK